jgi:hypothetical protein
MLRNAMCTGNPPLRATALMERRRRPDFDGRERCGDHFQLASGIRLCFLFSREGCALRNKRYSPPSMAQAIPQIAAMNIVETVIGRGAKIDVDRT